MEKEKKGLFGRLMEFWRGKIGMDEANGIGFWHEKADVENHFSEMGAVAVLSQEETKKTFWEKTESTVSEKIKEGFLTETVKEEKAKFPEETEKAGKQSGFRIFAAEVFREEKGEEAVMGIVVTTTIKINSQILKLLPVKTSRPVLQKDIEEIMKEISRLVVEPPFKNGEVVVKNICGKEVDLIATKNVEC